MSQALSLLEHNQQQWTSEQMKLITDVAAKGATKDELHLFLYRCNKLGLDPLKQGQIYFVKYGSTPGTIVVGIDGFRAKAARTGKLSGIKRGVIRDNKGLCIGAWAEIYRSDWQHPAREEVNLIEYNTGKAMWAKMPETMIKKVAEAAALRMAFPDDLGGLYAPEEMDQASRDGSLPVIAPEQPTSGDGNIEETHYKIPFGKYAQRTLEEIDLEQLRKYVCWIENRAKDKNEVLKGEVLDFVSRAANYIAAMENGLNKNDAESENDHF